MSNYLCVMEDELRAHILALSRLYVGATKAAFSTIAMKAARDARFFDRLKDGKGFTVKTYDTVLRWFSENWPADAVWPTEIDRPALAPAEKAVA